MEKKWSFVDLDGTLLSKRKNITKGSLKAIKNYLDANNELVLCTGRWPVSTHNFNMQLEKYSGKKLSYFISLNGAYIYDLKNNAPLFVESIRWDVFEKLLMIQKKFKVAMWIYSLDGIKDKIIYAKKIPFKKIVSKFNFGVVKNYNHDLLKNDPKIKILFMSFNKKKINKVYEWLKTSFYDYLTVIKTSKHNIEITNKSIDKGSGLRFIQKHAKINTKSIYTFGDSGNDVAMFKEAAFRFSFGCKNKELMNNSNFVYKNNKHLKNAFDSITLQKNCSFKENTNLCIQFEQLKSIKNKLYFSKYLLFWQFVVNGNMLIIESKNYPYWVVANIFENIKFNDNIKFITANSLNIYSEKEKKFIFSKSFSDTQKLIIKDNITNKKIKVCVISKNDNKNVLVYRNEKNLEVFLHTYKLEKSFFEKCIRIDLLDIENEINNCISLSIYGELPGEFDKNFKVFYQDNIYFIFRKNSMNKTYLDKQNVKTIKYDVFDNSKQNMDLIDAYLEKNKI